MNVKDTHMVSYIRFLSKIFFMINGLKAFLFLYDDRLRKYNAI